MEEDINRGMSLLRQSGATRFTGRYLCNGPVQHPHTEARIRLNGPNSGIELVYIGQNNPERIDNLEVRLQEDAIVLDVLARHPRRRAHEEDARTLERMERVLGQGYIVEHIDRNRIEQRDVRSLVSLYREAFPTYTAPLDEQSIWRMVVSNPTCVIRDRSGEIVSAAVAEVARVDEGDRPMYLCELSEMATRRNHRGRGLNTLAAERLIRRLDLDVDLFYAEARASHAPVNQLFSNLGFHYAGRLSKHCVLSGDHEVDELGPFENLNVWYRHGGRRAD